MMVARPADPKFRRLVGHRLWIARTERGLSKAELARRSGVGEATIYQAESAAAMPQLDTAARLAETLGVSIDWLVGQAAPVSPSPTLPQGAAQAHVTGGGETRSARAATEETDVPTGLVGTTRGVASRGAAPRLLDRRGGAQVHDHPGAIHVSA